MAVYTPPYYGQPFGGYGFQQIQQPMMQQPPTQTNQQPMIWVQGEAGAKSYLVAPGSTVPLWDSENQTIYLKTTDQSGLPSMRVLDYTERNNSTRQVQSSNAICRDEFDKLIARVAKLEGGMMNESDLQRNEQK